MIKAVIYARYSSDKQNEQSIEGQLTYCNKYAKEHDMTIVNQYIDRATTGTNDHRPAFQNMMKDSHTKMWDVILVYKLDRFSRNKYESAANKNILKKNGKKLISVTEYIPDSPEGIILESMLEGMAQYYSAELSQKVKRGNHESRLKGIFTTGHPPFGYDLIDKHLVINQKEAAVIKAIYHFFIKGLSYNEMLIALNNEKKFNQSGRTITKKLIEDIFQNIHYTGYYEYNGFVYDKIYPPIITKETWDKAHSNRPTHNIDKQHPYSKDYSKSMYLLMPKIYCGTCRKRMATSSGTSSTGEILHYYVCKNHKQDKNSCPTKSLRKELLEDVVFRALKNILKKDTIIDKMAKALYEKHQELAYDNPDVMMLLEKKDALESSISVLLETTKLSKNEKIAEQLKKFNKQLDEINTKIDRLKNKDLDDLTIDTIKAYMSYILGDKIVDDEEFRRKLSNHFINYVIIYPSKIVVSVRGFEPDLPDYEPRPDFENIDECLISQDKRRKVRPVTNGSPI